MLFSLRSHQLVYLSAEEIGNKDVDGCLVVTALSSVRFPKLILSNRMKLLSLKKATDGVHKYTATFETDGREKNISFGAKGMKDYTLFSPLEREERKRRYLIRHKAREDWSSPDTAGALSRWILWNKTTVSASLADYKRRFGL